MKSLQRGVALIVLILFTQCKPMNTNNTVSQNAINKDSITNIAFDKTAPVNDSSDIGVNWDIEKPISTFTLLGTPPLDYKLELINDSIAVLSQKIDSSWSEQDRFEFQPWLWVIDDEKIISQFRITDFDKDGDDDVLCWVMSNINGNEWTKVYLNDGNKLVKLIDDTQDTDIWDRPEYDSRKGIINCTMDGSAYGTSSESTFKLKGVKAIPLTKHEQDRTSETIKDFYYKGKNGKWKLVKTETEEIPEQE